MVRGRRSQISEVNVVSYAIRENGADEGTETRDGQGDERKKKKIETDKRTEKKR